MPDKPRRTIERERRRVAINRQSLELLCWLSARLGPPTAWHDEKAQAIWYLHTDDAADDEACDFIELHFGGDAPRVDVMAFCDTAKAVIGHCAIEGVPCRGPREIAADWEREDAARKIRGGGTVN